jgi:murein DD-endopeptidase MepM/ murein hydrolase activator NlpD
MDLKRWKLCCAAGVLVALVTLKLLVPDLGGGLRAKVAEALRLGRDSAAALETLGERLSLRTAAPADEAENAADADAALTLVPVTAAPGRETRYLRYTVEEAVPAGETGPVVPAVVSAFLAQQAAFTDEPIPARVDSAFHVPPFAYVTPVSGCNSSGFGFRLHPLLRIVRFHYGTDFAANSGAEVRAFADGTVSFAGYDDSFGYHLRIDHGGGWESHYAHCSELKVCAGARVSAGTCVALVGATGLATGPHLHFELTKDGLYVNPEYYLSGGAG